MTSWSRRGREDILDCADNIPHKEPTYQQHLLEGLRKAGLPE
jgi:hypothetical protein